MCTMVLQETVNYDTANEGHVFCTFLDATKAFDRVKYFKFFNCLLDRKLPDVIFRFLCKLYTSHITRVIKNGMLSWWFNVVNGVKQGGVLSPVLFCIYVDGLLLAICTAGFGCFICSMFTGILAYADDIALLVPTVLAMRKMLWVCEEYASEYYVLFNASKSKCIICVSLQKSMCDYLLNIKFTLTGKVIETVKSWASPWAYHHK